MCKAMEEMRNRAEAIGIEKGRAEGEAKGRAEGEAKGRAEGEAKGRAEGEAKGRAEILQALRTLGIDSKILESAIAQLNSINSVKPNAE